MPGDIQSRAQDHWGYYNGAAQNDYRYRSLVPGCILPGLNGRVIVQAGAHRDVSPDSVQAGILTQIQYPTGGYSTFTYESNEYGYINQVPVPAVTQYPTKRVLHDVSAGAGLPGLAVTQCDEHLMSFIVPKPKVRRQRSDGSYTDSVAIYITTSAGSAGNSVGIHKPYAELQNAAGQRLKWSQYASATNPLRNPAPFIQWVLPGTYYLKAVACLNNGDDGSNGYDYAQMQIAYDVDDTTAVVLKKKAGGLRIRRIRDYSSPRDSLHTEKVFSYSEANNLQGSSGCIYGEPKYAYLSTYFWPDQNKSKPETQGVPTICDYWLRLSRNRTSLGTMQGSQIGYREVTVTNRVKQQPYSQSIYRFTSPVEYPDDIVDQVPFPPARSFGHRTGLLLTQTDYRQSQMGWVAIHQAANTYQFYEEQIPGFAIANPNTVASGIAGNIPFFRNSCITQLGHAQPVNSQEILFNESGTGSQVQEQTFRYDISGTRLRQQTQSLGLNTIKLITHWYSPDYRAPVGSLYDHMVQDLHALEPIESVTTYVRAGDSTIVEAGLQGFELPNSKLRLVTERKLRTAVPLAASSYHYSAYANSAAPDSHLEKRLVIDSYDAVGNVTGLHQLRGAPIARLWGYGRAYLLAEVRNATYVDVVTILGQVVIDQLAGLQPGNDAQVRALLRPLREQLKKAQVVTYTYQPLVGLTSQTDPTGRTTTYEYDQFNRLIRTRDEQGRILSQQQYHYAGAK